MSRRHEMKTARTSVRRFVSRLVAISALVPSVIAAQTPKPKEPTDSGPRRPAGQTTECVVSRIIDGDTFECRGGERIRMLGIDAPESAQKPFGPTSARELGALLPTGSRARLETDVQKRDRYGRLLAYVWLNDRQINWAMIRGGWAVVLTYSPNVRYVDSFTSAQRRARDEKRGLWSVDGFACLPVDHRQRRC